MAQRGPKPELITVDGRRMTKRQAAQWLGLSVTGLQHRLDKGLPLVPKGKPKPAPGKKPKATTVKEIRNSYAEEVHTADQQPGSILTARDIALAAFDYGLEVGKRCKKGSDGVFRLPEQAAA